MRIDPSALARFGRLSLLARQVVEGFLSGLHKSPYKGFSVEFAEHRQYYPGDEIRHVDWRVLGKTDRYYVKEFEEETNLHAHLVLDASGSMGYRGAAAASKLEYGQQVAACLAYLMLHQRDAVGLAIHDTALRQHLWPRATSKHLVRVLRALEEVQPGGETSLAPMWHSLASQVKRRGLIVILSDCLDELGPVLYALRHLRHRRHEVLLFHLVAPEEMDFPFARPTQFRNLEQPGQQVLMDPRRLRQEYLKNFGDFRRDLKRRAGDMLVDYHLLRTDAPVERALGVYLNRRLRRG